MEDDQNGRHQNKKDGHKKIQEGQKKSKDIEKLPKDGHTKIQGHRLGQCKFNKINLIQQNDIIFML